MSHLVLDLDGQEIRLHPGVSKNGNIWYCVSKGGSLRTRGVKVPGSTLPESIKLDGEELPVKRGVTQTGNSKVGAYAPVTIAGESYRTQIQLSDTGTGLWLIAKVIPAGGGGGAAVTDWSDLD